MDIKCEHVFILGKKKSARLLQPERRYSFFTGKVTFDTPCIRSNKDMTTLTSISDASTKHCQRKDPHLLKITFIDYYQVVNKVFVFFSKILFLFFQSNSQLAFKYISTTTIYHLSPTFWQGQDPEFVEVLGLLIEEVDQFHFDIVLVVELFLT